MAYFETRKREILVELTNHTQNNYQIRTGLTQRGLLNILKLLLTTTSIICQLEVIQVVACQEVLNLALLVELKIFKNYKTAKNQILIRFPFPKELGETRLKTTALIVAEVLKQMGTNCSVSYPCACTVAPLECQSHSVVSVSYTHLTLPTTPYV